MSTIRDVRVRAGLTAAEVASAVGRSAEWLGLVEVGASRLRPDEEKTILVAIGRLERFAQTVAEAKEKLTSDLKLPSKRRSEPHRNFDLM